MVASEPADPELALPHVEGPRVVVAAAIVRAGRVLAACRATPPELAGRWEFPGGKVEPGESERAALARECREELGVEVGVDERLGPDVDLPGGRLLRLFAAELLAGEPVAHEHRELRWLGAGDLAEVDWLNTNAPLLGPLRRHLAES